MEGSGEVGAEMECGFLGGKVSLGRGRGGKTLFFTKKFVLQENIRIKKSARFRVNLLYVYRKYKYSRIKNQERGDPTPNPIRKR